MPSPMVTANPSIGAAGRPQPQTTQESAGGPPLRYMRSAERPGYVHTNATPFSQNVTDPLPSAPGYLRWLDSTFAVVGNGGTGGVAAADAPFNFVNFLQLKDSWGTPLFTGDGYSLLYLLRKYAGMAGLLTAADVTKLPSYSAPAATGAFTFRSTIPLEGAKGYGVLSVGSAALLPTLQVVTSASATVYSTAPSVLPNSWSFTCDEAYYDVDPNNPVQPLGNGSTFQTSVVTGNQGIGSGSSTRVQLPRTGGYLTSLILVLRDNTGARVDAWNSSGRIRLYVDGVPRFDETFTQLVDRMYEVSQVARDSGVVAYSFKESLSQLNLGYLDSLETAMQTNPGTLLEVEMTPWGAISSPPAQLQAIVTQLVPAGPPVMGLPEA